MKLSYKLINALIKISNNLENTVQGQTQGHHNEGNI